MAWVKISSLEGNTSYAALPNGIKLSLLPNVFDRFFHDSEAKSQGSGLGLSIAKTIIELHEGNLTLHSDKKGTSLIISLPLIKKSS